MLTHGVTVRAPSGALGVQKRDDSKNGSMPVRDAGEALPAALGIASVTDAAATVDAPVRTQGRWVEQQPERDDSAASRVRPHKIGICIVPPEECWEQIQAIRRDNDRHYEKWIPHINLLFPITCTDDEVEAMPDALARIVADVKPFNVSLNSLGIFQHPLRYAYQKSPIKEPYYTSAKRPTDIRTPQLYAVGSTLCRGRSIHAMAAACPHQGVPALDPAPRPKCGHGHSCVEL